MKASTLSRFVSAEAVLDIMMIHFWGGEGWRSYAKVRRSPRDAVVLTRDHAVALVCGCTRDIPSKINTPCLSQTRVSLPIHASAGIELGLVMRMDPLGA